MLLWVIFVNLNDKEGRPIDFAQVRGALPVCTLSVTHNTEYIVKERFQAQKAEWAQALVQGFC